MISSSRRRFAGLVATTVAALFGCAGVAHASIDIQQITGEAANALVKPTNFASAGTAADGRKQLDIRSGTTTIVRVLGTVSDWQQMIEGAKASANGSGETQAAWRQLAFESAGFSTTGMTYGSDAFAYGSIADGMGRIQYTFWGRQAALPAQWDGLYAMLGVPRPDTTPPDTTITSGPPNSTSPDSTFTFTSTEAGSTFKCGVDGSPATTCTSPKAYSFGVGTHTVTVAATDAAGNVDPTPASWTWTISQAQTQVLIALDSGDSSRVLVSNVPSGTDHLHFWEGNSGTYPAPTMRYVDKPANTTSFKPDPDTLWVDVAAMPTAANGDPIGQWFSDFNGSRIQTTLDTTPPDTTITSGMSDGLSTNASFSFTSTEANSTFKCSLDRAAASSCTSPKTYSGLAVGSHTFTVAATDAAGNLDASAATDTWSVTAPDNQVRIAVDPADSTEVLVSNVPAGTDHLHFYQANSGTYPASSFQYVDKPPTTTAFRPTDPTQPWVDVAAMPTADNGTPTAQWFSDFSGSRVQTSPTSPPPDTTPPNTTITSGMNDGTSTSASFSFNSSEANSTFECKLDAAAFTGCTSPKTYSGLAVGSHTFSVRATDAAGNTDQTPDADTWTISSSPPPPTGFIKGINGQVRLEGGGQVSLHLGWINSLHATNSREDYDGSWSGWYPQLQAAGKTVLFEAYPNFCQSGCDGTYTQYLANHPEIKLVELINEPEWGTSGITYSAASYAAALHTMAQNIRAVRPDATLLCTAESASPFQGWNQGMVNAVGATQLRNDCDGWSVHLYTDGAYVDPNTAGPADGSSFAFDRVDKMRSTFLAAGIDKPFYVTEWGWSLYNTAKGAGHVAINDAQRSTYYQHGDSQIAARPWIKGSWPYSLYGYYQDPNNVETGFGLVNGSNGSFSPAFNTVAAFYASLP